MQSITINYKDFLKGWSTSKYYPDRGFSPQSVGIEVSRLNSSFGLLCPGRSLDSLSTNIADKIVATTPYFYNTALRYFSIGAAGKLYSTVVSTGAHTVQATEGTKTYDDFSDIIVYGGSIYITSSTGITLSNMAGDSIDHAWWTTTKSRPSLTANVPHKLLEYKGTLYITDGNKLHSWDGANIDQFPFALSAGWIITDIIIENGLLSIAASYSVNDVFSNTPTKIFFWDGYSESVLDETPLDVPNMEALKNIDGKTFFFAGGSLYRLIGKQYQLIYSLSFDALNWKKVVVNKSNIYFKTLNGIGCYDTRFGSISHPVFINTGVATINVLANGFYDYLDVFTNVATTYNMYRCQSNLSSGDPTFYSNFYEFSQPVYIRKVKLIFSAALTTNAGYTVALLDEKEAVIKSIPITFANKGGIITDVEPVGGLPVEMFQLACSFNHSACKNIRAFKIYYEPSERDTTK